MQKIFIYTFLSTQVHCSFHEYYIKNHIKKFKKIRNNEKCFYYVQKNLIIIHDCDYKNCSQHVGSIYAILSMFFL